MFHIVVQYQGFLPIRQFPGTISLDINTIMRASHQLPVKFPQPNVGPISGHYDWLNKVSQKAYPPYKYISLYTVLDLVVLETGCVTKYYMEFVSFTTH